jgi:hypothetical protein
LGLAIVVGVLVMVVSLLGLGSPRTEQMVVASVTFLGGVVLTGSALIAAAISSSGVSSRRVHFRGEDDALEIFRVNDD